MTLGLPTTAFDPLAGVCVLLPDAAAADLLLAALLNQPGKPCRNEKPPGGKRSSSVADTVPESCIAVVYMYVVSGVIKGWNMSVVKVMTGGSAG